MPPENRNAIFVASVVCQLEHFTNASESDFNVTNEEFTFAFKRPSYFFYNPALKSSLIP